MSRALRYCTVALAVLVAFLSFTARARAGWMISDTTLGTPKLYDYTQGSGNAVNPRTVTGIVSSSILVGIDFSSTGQLFGLAGTTDNRLYRINPASGAATLVGATGLTGIIEGGLAFDPTTNILYGMYTSTGSNFFTLNTTTGAGTTVGAIAGDDPSGMAFDNVGNLWIVNSNINTTNVPTLLRVNKATGATITSQSTGINLASAILGLDFDPTTNLLYMAGGDGKFYTINTTTGAGTQIDTHNVAGAGGLAYVPEPASLSLLVAGAAAVLGRRRRISVRL